MYNDLLSIGPVTLHTYGLMIAIAILAAVMVMEARARQKGTDISFIYNLAFLCVACGFAGAKLLYLVTVLPEVVSGSIQLTEALSGGWVVFGAVLSGMLAGLVYLKKHRLPVAATFDLAMPSIALAQCIGRIGCFFAGCCYGVEWEGPLGITFSHSAFAPNHVRLFPTQLVSSAGDLVIFGLLLLADRRKGRRDWQVTALYLILYSIGRFVLEYFRGDAERGAVGPFSTSQFIAVFTLAAGVILLLAGGRKKHDAREQLS